MEPEIRNIPAKKLVGISQKMSLINNKTSELWRKFMPRLKEIKNRNSDDLISMQVYHEHKNFAHIDPDELFEKWAVAEVSDYTSIPAGMETFDLPGGTYAVFQHKGGPATAPAAFNFIFGQWIPSSPLTIDHRPHFELLGSKYKNNDPDSEEEIWIPVKGS